MKSKKIISIFTAASVMFSLSSCVMYSDGSMGTNSVQTDLRCSAECTCDCEGCVCSGLNAETEEIESSVPIILREEATTEIQSEKIEAETQTEAENQTQIESETENDDPEVTLNEIELLSEGEKAARREQQVNFAEARQSVYMLPNSKSKTEKINQMDRQILANNSYDFSKKNIVFIGDSITEGITSAIDQNGNFVSYVTYANSFLHFKRVLNHGVGGRMFSTYGGEELSIAMNFGNVTNIDSDIIVVFVGVNDFLSNPANKRFGNVDDKMSTAGYCGSVRYFMKQLKEYYGNREVFFVTMYDMNKKSECQYSDVSGQPSLNDYLEVQRKLAKEYGFNVIELYNVGFMDCTSKEAADYYLRDGLHPKDNGSIALGEHIAAELSLYFSQKEK